MSATTKPTVTLAERADALATVNDWIAEHADEVLLNGGALPPELEQLLDEAEGDFRTKVERVAFKRRELQGHRDRAKAEQDYYAQRARMWGNADESLRSYLQRAMKRAGETSVKTALATVWLQASPPSLRHQYDDELLLKIHDSDLSGHDLQLGNHPLARFVSVRRVASLDSRAVLAAYQAREAELQAEAATLELTDVEATAIAFDAHGAAVARDLGFDGVEPAIDEALDDALATKRTLHVEEGLAAAFPGVTVTRLNHVRQR